MRIPDRGSTTGSSQLDRLSAQRTGCPKGEQSESIPPSPPYFEKELVRKYGLFFRILHACGGMRIPDRGSTTGASQLDRLSAKRTGCPKGEQSESIPPSPPYFKKSSYESTGFFFVCRSSASCRYFLGSHALARATFVNASPGGCSPGKAFTPPPGRAPIYPTCTATLSATPAASLSVSADSGASTRSLSCPTIRP